MRKDNREYSIRRLEEHINIIALIVTATTILKDYINDLEKNFFKKPYYKILQIIEKIRKRVFPIF